MSNIAALARRIDILLAAIEAYQQASQDQQRIMVCLPIKDGEPLIPYQQGNIYFYTEEMKGLINHGS